jgi:hypothetical protein
MRNRSSGRTATWLIDSSRLYPVEVEADVSPKKANQEHQQAFTQDNPWLAIPSALGADGAGFSVTRG